MMQRPKKRETIVPPKKPYTKDQFFKSTVLQLKGMSGGVDRKKK
jgi:hypothetical protein